jgi:hypothetical protein
VTESGIDRWLRRRAVRDQRLVLLEEGLLGDRLWRYSSYRLRYFGLGFGVEMAAHTVAVLLLFEALEWTNFLLVVIGTAATALVSSFWWGALEGLRARVRDLHRSGSPHRIPRAVGGWLALAIVLAAAVLAGAIAWVVGRAATGGFGAAEAYVAALLLRLALDLVTRAYHSGVYAIRRVYKPLPATLAPELLGLAAMLALWPLAGVWGVVAGSVVTTVAATAATLVYTRRVYHFLGFAPAREVRVETLGEAIRAPRREALAGGFAHAMMAVDSLAVLALLYGAEADSESLLVLFLAMPAIRAGFDWARLLYFDLKRLELRLFTNLRRRFERHTLRLASLLGVVFWAVAAAVAAAYYGSRSGALVLALLAFFVARSLLARVQIQAFADGSYGAVLATGVLFLGGLAAVGPLAEGEPERLGAIAAAAAAAAVVLARVRHVTRARGEPGVALLTLEWLRRLGHLRGAVRVGSARIASAAAPDRLDARGRDERDRWRLSQLAEQTARRLGAAGAAAWVGPDRVIWFQRGIESARVTAEWLQRASGGLVASVIERECATGEEALLTAGNGGLLGDASPHLLTPIVPVDVEAAARTFTDLIRGGVVYSADAPVPPALAALPRSELRAIFADATVFARDLRVRRRRSRFDVTALCSGGELRLIFVADPQAGRSARGRWRHLVTTMNVRGAVGGVRSRPRPARARRLSFARLDRRAPVGASTRPAP